MFVLQYNHFTFEELLKSLAQIALVAKEIDPNFSTYLDDDLKPLQTCSRSIHNHCHHWITLDKKVHQTLSDEGQFNNISFLKNWLWEVIESLAKRELIITKKLSDCMIMINKPGGSLDLGECKDPKIKAELANERGCRILFQVRYNGIPMDSFKTACCHDPQVNSDTRSWNFLHYFISPQIGFRETFAYVHPLNNQMTKSQFQDFVSRGEAKVIQSKKLPFPKTLDHPVIQRFKEHHPQMIDKTYSTITLLQVKEFKWANFDREPTITKGKRLLKMIWITPMKGYLLITF